MRRIWKIGLVVVFGLGLAGCAWLFAPPQAVLTADRYSGTAPLHVQFDLSGSTGDIVSYTLTFGDGSDPATGLGITVAVLYTYANPGTYTATLTVQDARGRTSSASVVIMVSAAPTAAVSLGAFPALGSAPLTVDFSATITAAPGRRIKHLALDYGDGEPEYEADVDFENYSGPIVSHEYADPDTYTATLTVTDDASPAQTFTATATITVTSPPPEIISFTADPQTPSVGADVTFAFEAEAGDARKLVKWELRSGDGYVVTVNLPTPVINLNVTYNHTYDQTGSYTATVKVWDDNTPTANTAEADLDVDVVDVH
ncbi:MAG: PKD domain-containing protein [Candidatus Bipolaricaulis sp.]|nr:PKD domain-containing protein [Candidatus Bipolaricaulis sp.]